MWHGGFSVLLRYTKSQVEFPAIAAAFPWGLNAEMLKSFIEPRHCPAVLTRSIIEATTRLNRDYLKTMFADSHFHSSKNIIKIWFYFCVLYFLY